MNNQNFSITQLDFGCVFEFTTLNCIEWKVSSKLSAKLFSYFPNTHEFKFEPISRHSPNNLNRYLLQKTAGK